MRVATAADFDAIAEMAQEFNHGYYDVPIDTSKMHAWFMQHIQHGVILMGKRSYVSALLINDPLRDWLAVVETGWFADDGQGARLMLGLIKYAKEQYADELRVCTMNTSPPEAGAMLVRLGFEMNKECSHSLKL